ncbi:phosphonate utilization associated transcriptional regulator [Thauera sp. CAU 1555]|uniref:Phosphonate utilization associated transcriptional regulator n=1 Tax=Thauera sedimentorum TaxID=2767595 RepID=A0ABR9B6M0_9RHOO|nr:phosphonate utilization associated transcriptional regulator [Thauera sedimentorum]MBC9070917.1 phosphonate utilization associated transcriptional regulator [Thauera sedimentorum]MBD8501836.1 phosphonate utilization associated transcriptional regulator [Thauera sedimentorum]
MAALLDDPADTALALVQRTSLTRLVADSLERLILSGELSPGAKLNEVALADRLGVSRGPLREAFRTLEEYGLIRQEKNRGAFVREIALAEAADIYDVRAGLDATAGRLLAQRITPAQLAILRALVAAMRDAAGTDDIQRFHALNLGFHDRIIEMTGNRTLRETYRRLVKQLTLFRRRNLLAPRAIPHFAEEHGAIVDLLARRDAEGCAKALFEHAQGGRQRMLMDGELADTGQ